MNLEYINPHRHMNVEIGVGTEAAQFPEKEYINGIFPCSARNLRQRVIS